MRIVLSGLAGQVTAKADAGIITATGLTGAFVSLTTDVGAILVTYLGVAASGSAEHRQLAV